MRIFLASPSDVENYRQAVLRVVERLEREARPGAGSRPPIEIVDWNARLAPFETLPERAILDQIRGDADGVFVGIAWLGFDRRSTSGDGAALATERNFELALELWKRERPKACYLCRCMRLPEKLTDIDGLAFDRVSRFFSRFSLEDENPVRYYEFDSSTDLEEHLAAQLGRHVGELAGPEPAPARMEPAEAEPASELERRMDPGKAYEVSFLAIDIAPTEAFDEARKSDPEAVAALEASFRNLVGTTARPYGGEIFSWQGGGGLVLFWSQRSYDHAIMTGLKVLHNLPVFNLDPAQNPAGLPIKTRSAAHDAVIIFELPVSEVRSADIDFVVELQRRNTDPGELSITRRLLERVDPRLKPHFKYKGRFGSEPIYACRLPSAGEGPSRTSLKQLRRRLRLQLSEVRQLLAEPAAELDAAKLDELSAGVNDSYSLLNKFAAAFSGVDRGWQKGLVEEIGAAAAELKRQEGELWRALRERHADRKGQGAEAIVQTAARRRTRPVVILEKLLDRCRELTGSEADVGAPSPSPEAAKTALDGELAKKIDAFVRADDLDSETLLTDLLLNRQTELVAYLSAPASDGRRARLVDKLWHTADFVLLEDLDPGGEGPSAHKVFDALVNDPVADPRFGMVQRLLASARQPTREHLAEEFEAAGIEAEEDDFQTVWRCLVLGHENADIRNFSALQLSNHSMWQAIAHPSIPISSVYAIGERVNKREGEDAQKIFFDCIRARLESSVESFRGREEVSSLTKLILLLLDFPFLVETGYFERFDDLLGRFLEQAREAGLKVEYFESLRKTLEKARSATPEKESSKPPSGLNRLPLIIQRRLAGEARYAYWFVSHPDARIAGETLRHVGLMNVERVLRLREVNGSVFSALLRKPELFTRHQAVVAALHHPKCDQQFANHYLPSLSRSPTGQAELKKIANDPSANPVVRAAAKRALAGRARARQR